MKQRKVQRRPLKFLTSNMKSSTYQVFCASRSRLSRRLFEDAMTASLRNPSSWWGDLKMKVKNDNIKLQLRIIFPIRVYGGKKSISSPLFMTRQFRCLLFPLSAHELGFSSIRFSSNEQPFLRVLSVVCMSCEKIFDGILQQITYCAHSLMQNLRRKTSRNQFIDAPAQYNFVLTRENSLPLIVE